MAIDQLVNKALKKVDFKSRHSVNGSGSGGDSFVKSDMTCHKCDKKVHIKKYCRSKGNVSSGNLPKNFTNEIPKRVTKNPVVLDTKYLVTSTMNRNNSNYKWYTSCNNGNSEWGFNLKDIHEEWGKKQGKK